MYTKTLSGVQVKVNYYMIRAVHAQITMSQTVPRVLAWLRIVFQMSRQPAIIIIQ